MKYRKNRKKQFLCFIVLGREMTFRAPLTVPSRIFDDSGERLRTFIFCGLLYFSFFIIDAKFPAIFFIKIKLKAEIFEKQAFFILFYVIDKIILTNEYRRG